MTDPADRLTRMERRLERERSARLQAEEIAERAIADLTAVNRALDQRVVDRTADLESTLARLAAADAVKSTFLRGVAHEMSTPLHAISGLVELIDDRSSDPEIRAAAKHAGRAAVRLNSALRTLVELAAATSGDVSTTVETFTLGEYADAVAGRWRLAAARHGVLLMVEVSPEPGVTVEADPARLDQILDALIDNAVLFGATAADVHLLRIGGPHPRLRIVVGDDGPGVEPDLRDRLFESFVRGNHAADGFGIGLTLARLVAEALGGTLELNADNRPDGRDRFVAEIPIR